MMKKKNKLSKDNYLDKIPVIAQGIEWEATNGTIVIHQHNKGFYAKIAQKFFGSPKESRIRLDAFGSYVWQCIDGKNDIHEIGLKVKSRFGNEAEPLYERLCQFMETLNRVHYIEFVSAEKDA